MSNITIYLEDELEQRLRQAAKGEGLSVSKLVAQLVERGTAITWPDEILNLAGSWKDEDISLPEYSSDAPRESM